VGGGGAPTGWPKRPVPADWRKRPPRLGRCRPGVKWLEPAPWRGKLVPAIRLDRLGGTARASRFGRFRTKGSSRVPLPPRSSHGLGFRLNPGSNVWQDIASGAYVNPHKRPGPNPTKAKLSKRTKPNPALSLEDKRGLLQASKGRTRASKRIKPLPAVPSSVRPPNPSQRKVFLGSQPNLVHYPPPNKRGHSGTGNASSDTSSQDSSSDDDEIEVEVRKEVFGLLSISEKFAMLSRPPTSESTRILRTKGCFSMHVVRGLIGQSMKKREKQKRDPSHRTPFNRESPFSS
jgi:hypothetical protein